MGAEGGRNLKREWWLSGGIIVGTLAASVVTLAFLSGDLSGQAAAIISDRGFIAGQNAALGNFAALKSDAAKAAPYMDAMRGLLPTHDALIGFPEWLNTVGGSHKVSVSVTFTGNDVAASGDTPGSQSFSLSATGAGSDVTSFLDDIETKAQGYLLSIDSFDLVNEGTDYRLTAQGNVFSQ